MDGDAMLCTLDLQQFHVAVDTCYGRTCALDRDERVTRPVHEQRRHRKLANRLIRSEVEHLVQQRPAELERRIVEQEALLSQLMAGRLASED